MFHLEYYFLVNIWLPTSIFCFAIKKLNYIIIAFQRDFTCMFWYECDVFHFNFNLEYFCIIPLYKSRFGIKWILTLLLYIATCYMQIAQLCYHFLLLINLVPLQSYLIQYENEW